MAHQPSPTKTPTTPDPKGVACSALTPSPSGGGLGWGAPTQTPNDPTPISFSPFSRSSARARGLSLVQLMVVIFIIGLLMAMTVGGISGMKNANAANNTKATIAVLDATLDEFKSASGEYPRIYGTKSDPVTSTEVAWVNAAVTQLGSLEQNATMLSKLGRYKETRTNTTPFGTPLTNFRNTTAAGIPLKLDSPAGTVSATDMETLRAGGSLTLLRDGWDRPIYYFPSDTASADTAATLRPVFASAGRDGKLQSTPWTAGAWVVGAHVYYKSKWYQAVAAATGTPGTDTNWQEVTSDDFVTRGN